MAVKNKVPDSVRIAKIHSQPYTGIGKSSAVIVRNVDGIAQKRLVYRPAAVIKQHEMQLVNMESVEFPRPVFDDPILNRSLLGNDVRNARFWIEFLGRLAVYR